MYLLLVASVLKKEFEIRLLCPSSKFMLLKYLNFVLLHSSKDGFYCS